MDDVLTHPSPLAFKKLPLQTQEHRTNPVENTGRILRVAKARAKARAPTRARSITSRTKSKPWVVSRDFVYLPHLHTKTNFHNVLEILWNQSINCVLPCKTEERTATVWDGYSLSTRCISWEKIGATSIKKDVKKKKQDENEIQNNRTHANTCH